MFLVFLFYIYNEKLKHDATTREAFFASRVVFPQLVSLLRLVEGVSLSEQKVKHDDKKVKHYSTVAD